MKNEMDIVIENSLKTENKETHIKRTRLQYLYNNQSSKNLTGGTRAEQWFKGHELDDLIRSGKIATLKPLKAFYTYVDNFDGTARKVLTDITVDGEVIYSTPQN